VDLINWFVNAGFLVRELKRCSKAMGGESVLTAENFESVSRC